MKRHIVYSLLALLVAGCQSAPKQAPHPQSFPTPKPISAAPKPSAAQAAKLGQWQAKGKIAAHRDGEGGSASFVWENDNDFYKIRMFGPFGAGSAELTGSSRQVIFEQGDGQMNLAKSPEALLYQQTGLHIPVSGLLYWIKGIPSPYSQPAIADYNSSGQLTYLIQNDWTIEYAKHNKVQSHWLPGKITLHHDGMKVKIVIKQWDLL